MSDYGVSRSEMKRLSNMSDGDLEAMRAGNVPQDDPSMSRITQFVRDLGEAFPEPSTEHLESGHVAAMLQAARLTADKGEPACAPASKADGPGIQASGLPKPWRETMKLKMKTAFATRTAKVMAATMAMLLAFAGVAVAGVLPTPIQNRIADAAQGVGVNLPGGADEFEAEEIDVDDDVVDDAVEAQELEVEDTADEADSVDDENDDAQGEDADEQDGHSGDEAKSAHDADEHDSDDADDEDDDEHATVKKSTSTHRSEASSDDDDDDDEESASTSHESSDEHDGDSDESDDSEEDD